MNTSPSYWQFVRGNARFLLFGLITIFFANFGQTFFIAQFGAEFQRALHLSHADYGFYYSLATLISGVALLKFGGWLDRFSLPSFIGATTLLLLIACVLLAYSQSAWWWAVAIFCLRFSGQGMMTHAAHTSMARYFEVGRGKAISIAAMGMPLGEAILPIAALWLIAQFGWRDTWLWLALSLLVVFVPLAVWTLKGHSRRHQQWADNLQRQTRRVGRQWTRAEVLRDWRFYLALPAILAPAFLITGLFIHQAAFIAAKGWSLAWFAASFPAFAVSHALASLLVGPWVDRLGVRRILPWYLGPLLLSCIAFAALDTPWAAPLFLLLAGITVGASGPVLGSLWPEVYGTEHLGSIRALISSCMVLSTSVSPFLFGLWLDSVWSVTALLYVCGGYVLLCELLLRLTYARTPAS